jgi:superfamily II DNA/RNA helicase
MGFVPDIERICKIVPFTRQTLFFTATMPPEIRRITDQFLHNPTRVEVARPASTVDSITQKLVKTGREPHEKRETLRQLIRGADGLKNAIIFCNRKRDVATLHRSLQRHGFSAVALHGDMDQQARTAALEQFRKNEVTLLVASDVAARGLDIPDVSHVFNFDAPHHPDDYVHRIGRTGRAGRSGTAVTIVAPMDQKAVASIEKLIGQTIPWMEAPAPEPQRERVPRESREAGESSSPRHHGRRHGRGPVTLEGANRRPAPAPVTLEGANRRPPAGDDKVASIGNARSRRNSPQRQHDEAPDLRHFPAFLLRPIRAAKA